MARTNKRSTGETSGSSADSKKRKPSPLKSTGGALSTEGSRRKRPSPLKRSFKKGLSSPKRLSPPVTFNQAVNYDDGSQSDMSKPAIALPPKAVDEDVMATPGGRFANITPPITPGRLKNNPWYFPPTPPNTSTPAATEKKATQQKAPEKTRPEEKTTTHPKTQTWEEGAKKSTSPHQHDSAEAGRKVIEEVVTEPRALTLEEASDALMALRDEIRSFGTTHFSFELTAKEKRGWPLADLQVRNPEFVANCAYIADGSQYGWRQLFTESYCRPQLVTGLLAHYVVEHVFKHTCFGLNAAELARLENDVLKKYINWDGFVRSKQLAAEIGEILASKSAEDLADDGERVVRRLVIRIHSTISPLLPPPPPPGLNHTQAAASLEALVALRDIITHAQALALSLRLTGTNRTVFRYTFPSKQSEYQLGGGQNCLNVARVDATQHHAPDIDRDELRVKIPCWPTIIATVPTGPDMLDFQNDPTLVDRTEQEMSPQGNNPAAFVTEVFMTPSDVYCEWTPLASPLRFPHKLTLAQAISAARKQRALAHGQPWPPRSVAPWKRTARYLLAAGGIGLAAAAAVTATTPHGRRLLLTTANLLRTRVTKSKVKAKATAVARVLASALPTGLLKQRFPNETTTTSTTASTTTSSGMYDWYPFNTATAADAGLESELPTMSTTSTTSSSGMYDSYPFTTATTATGRWYMSPYA